MAPRPGGAAQERHRVLRGSGQHQVPDTCLQAYEDAGIRVILGECVTNQESSLSLPRYATPALSNTIFDTVPSIALSRFVLVPG